MVCCLLALTLVGSARRSLPHPTESQRATTVSLHASLHEGHVLFRAGRYQEAATRFQSVWEAAQSQHIQDLSGRALGNLGACRFALHQYQAALRMFLEARRRSEAAQDAGAVGAMDANIASVYVQMGEYGAAAEWVERSIARLSGRDRQANLPRLQIQMATLRARQRRWDEGLELFRQGLAGADRAGDLELYALGCGRLGEEWRERGDLAQAERALLAAYYVRKLHRLPLGASYGLLGQLRLDQGDLRSAAVLLDQAVELANRPDGPLPSWQIYDARGRVRLAQGRLREALADLRIALRLARAWRDAAARDDTARVGVEGKLAPLHAAFVEAGNRLYEQTGDPALLEETFAAEEENRASSLRALRNRPGAEAPRPPEYWEALERLQRAEVAALRQHDGAGVSSARADLARLEVSLGPELGSIPPNLAEASRRTLGRQTALLSFHVGRSVSWLWALDESGLALYRLPPKAEIEARVGRAAAAIREDQPEAEARSAELYATLFGSMPPRFQRAPHWLIALDESLFEVPVAALIARRGLPPDYVIEHHTIEIIPGAAYCLQSAPDPSLPPLFVGVGDPVYNTADARARRPHPASAAALALPRLVGSGAEVEACSRAWNGPSVLLRGGDASPQKLLEQLRRHPAAVHLATHYLESAAAPGYGLIALTLAPNGEPELLTPFEISRWRIQAGLVVLSGCHSAAGPALPATGLAGLTRAWLAAGAQAVAASLWALPDDDGALFRSLYRSLRPGSDLDPSRALREAQLEMIRSGGPRARPRYWGAYFLAGRPGRTVIQPRN